MQTHTITHTAAEHYTLSSSQQAKKGLLTLTVRTRLTAPHSLSSHLSPPLCRSLSSSTCATKDGSSFGLESPAAPASSAKANYRVMVEVSLQKGRGAVPPPPLSSFTFLLGSPATQGSPALPSSGVSRRSGQGAVGEQIAATALCVGRSPGHTRHLPSRGSGATGKIGQSKASPGRTKSRAGVSTAAQTPRGLGWTLPRRHLRSYPWQENRGPLELGPEPPGLSPLSLAEAGVGLGIGLCSVPYFQCISGIFVHTLSPGSVAHLDGRLR